MGGPQDSKIRRRDMNLKELEGWVKEARAFLKPIIPPNWNVHTISKTKNKGMSFKPNALNINVWFVEEEEDFLGEVHGPLRFYPVGLWASVYPASRRASKEFPHALFSQIELRLSFLWNLSREGTLVHEMAHIAAVRAHARRIGRKARKDRSVVGQNFEEDMHGPLFCKAFRRLIIRTEKVYGKERAKDMRIHLKYFQKGREKNGGRKWKGEKIRMP